MLFLIQQGSVQWHGLLTIEYVPILRLFIITLFLSNTYERNLFYIIEIHHMMFGCNIIVLT
jgi:hypothetical protein